MAWTNMYTAIWSFLIGSMLTLHSLWALWVEPTFSGKWNCRYSKEDKGEVQLQCSCLCTVCSQSRFRWYHQAPERSNDASLEFKHEALICCSPFYLQCIALIMIVFYCPMRSFSPGKVNSRQALARHRLRCVFLRYRWLWPFYLPENVGSLYKEIPQCYRTCIKVNKSRCGTHATEAVDIRSCSFTIFEMLWEATALGLAYPCLKLVELWYVVGHSCYRGDEQQISLSRELPERVDDGEVAFDGHGHGDEDGADAADVAYSERHWHDVQVHGAIVIVGEGAQAVDGEADRQVQEVERRKT